MRKYVIIGIVCFLVVLGSVDVDAQRRRNRTRNRKKSGPNCHLKEIDKCLEKMEALGKRPHASNIIATEEGLNELCSTVTGTTDCMKAYMKKCGTPIQRELFDFIIEQFVESVNDFCKGGDSKETFLKHSPCINEKILSTKEYHTKCVNDIFAAIDKGQRLLNSTIDDAEVFNFEKSSAKSLSDKLLDISCCAYNRFEKCTNELIVKECGPDGVAAMNDFADKTFGGGMNRICPKKIFNLEKKLCDILPPVGSDPKKQELKNNPFGKYMLTYLNFMFNFDDVAAAAAA